MASLGDSIRSGTKWLFAGNIAGQALQFVFGVVLARLLVPADFGMIVTIRVFTGFAGMVMSGGMGQSLIRAKEADENDFNAVFTMQLAVSILVYLTFYFTAPMIAAFFDNSLYTELVRISTLVFLLRPFSLMYNAWLSREMNFKTRSMVGLLTGGVTGISGIAMAWFGLGVWSLILSGLIGALFSNLLLGRILPIRLKIKPDLASLRKHSAYGFKVVLNNFLGYLTKESKNLVLSKVAGPAFLGLFNKGESLSRMPNQMIMPSTMQPVFRAMSKVQDDLDQTKYMLYRAITLLTTYTLPFYIGAWWVAEPFIGSVYGAKWLPSADAMRILVLSGLFFNITYPCGVVLDAQNKLKQELVVQIIQLAIVISACIIGLEWGLRGVAWGILFGNIFGAFATYYLVYRTLHTQVRELISALTPGLILGSLFFIVLAVTHFALGETITSAPMLYLTGMTASGASFYATAFLLIPIPALRTEAARWRGQLHNIAKTIRKIVVESFKH